jgi:hypothetical protein
MTVLSYPYTLGIALPEPRAALIRGMLSAGLAHRGYLSRPWCRVDAPDADVQIVDTEASTRTPTLCALVRLPARPSVQITLPWPLRSQVLFTALNGIATLLERHANHLLGAEAEAPVAHALIEDWALSLAQGETYVMFRSAGVDLMHCSLETDACLVPPEFVVARTLGAEPWQLARNICEARPSMFTGVAPGADWLRVCSARAFLWAMGGLSAPDGVVQAALSAPRLGLRAWPYPIARGPAAWGRMANALRDEPMSARTLFGHVTATKPERTFFINACLAAGFLDLRPAQRADFVRKSHHLGEKRLRHALAAVRKAFGLDLGAGLWR